MKLNFYSFSSAANTVENNSFKTNLQKAFALAFLLTISVASFAQMNLKFGTNYTRINGVSGSAAGSGNSGSSTALREGARYLYSDVATGFDCIVTVDDIQDGASLYAFDNNSSIYDGEVNRFQPIITSPQSCARKSYVKFKFQLIQADSYTGGTGSGTAKTPTEPIWFRAYDIDGNGGSNGISEFVEVSKEFTGSWVDNPTSLTAVTSTFMTGADQYKISTPTNNGTDISDDGDLAFNGFIYANTANTFYIIGGSYTGGNQGDPVGTNQLTDADRLNSWSFCTTDVKPGVDFGDAPASYNGITPIAPAYHVIPSIGNNQKIYLGIIKPDADFDPSGNAAANVDDVTPAGSTDDEDGITYSTFPAYLGSGNYTITVNTTNKSGANAYAYGYIDFNGDGDFNDVNERSLKATVSSSTTSPQSVSLTFSAGFAFNASTTNRYIRIRIGSNADEVCYPNGPARDGEVEDYVFKSLYISGTVFNDANGLVNNGIIDGIGIGNASGAQLYAILVSNTTNKVVESETVSSNGAYTFNNVDANQSYKIVLSLTAGTVGSAAPAATLATPWLNTGEGADNKGDNLIDGITNISTGTGNLSSVNFGIERAPDTNPVSIGLTNPAINTSIALTSKPLNGQDPEDSPVTGSLSTSKVFKIDSIPAANKMMIFYNGSQLTVGSTISNYQPNLLTVKFIAAPAAGQSYAFKYSTVDAAGVKDPTPALYTISVTSILPLNGMNLSANQQGSNVKLTWDVTGERNVIRYELEYSVNSQNFTSAATVSYRSSANGDNKYTYTHIPVVTTGMLYYRVVQYRADGSSNVSNQVVVRLSDKAGSSVTVMPTLITSTANVNIHAVAAIRTTINVIDNNGKLVMKREVALANGSNSFTLDGWNALANGTYYIQVNAIEAKSSVRVTVQH
jgi:hypothetical protein